MKHRKSTVASYATELARPDVMTLIHYLEAAGLGRRQPTDPLTDNDKHALITFLRRPDAFEKISSTPLPTHVHSHQSERNMKDAKRAAERPCKPSFELNLESKRGIALFLLASKPDGQEFLNAYEIPKDMSHVRIEQLASSGGSPPPATALEVQVLKFIQSRELQLIQASFSSEIKENRRIALENARLNDERAKLFSEQTAAHHYRMSTEWHRAKNPVVPATPLTTDWWREQE
jgi:hypothetical protein